MIFFLIKSAVGQLGMLFFLLSGARDTIVTVREVKHSKATCIFKGIMHKCNHD